jgi:zinc D-Ala-D-Ala carboxypeptidase
VTRQLSPHFTLDEFLHSDVAARMGRELVPSLEIIANLERLAVTLLEPIRVALGKPVTITSGWRPDWLNTLIGGSNSSEHCFGRAADFHVAGVPAIEISAAVVETVATLPFNQLIHEFDAWTHISVCAINEQPRRQVLTARRIGSTTRYLSGIIPKAAA